jgi:hypothetical protein
MQDKIDISLTDNNEVIYLHFEDFFDEAKNKLLDKENLIKATEEELLKFEKEFNFDEITVENLFSEFVYLCIDKKEEFYNALNERNYEKIHKISHFLKGAALELRIAEIAFILKTIDEETKNNSSIIIIDYLINEFYNLINLIIEKNVKNIKQRLTEKKSLKKPKDEKRKDNFIKKFLFFNFFSLFFKKIFH